MFLRQPFVQERIDVELLSQVACEITVTSYLRQNCGIPNILVLSHPCNFLKGLSVETEWVVQFSLKTVEGSIHLTILLVILQMKMLF